jgi:hypothetical protein
MVMELSKDEPFDTQYELYSNNPVNVVATRIYTARCILDYTVCPAYSSPMM